jgi:thioredoxin reductase (NADPH)
MMEKFFNTDDIKDLYDIVIIGAGPAGLAAGIYAARDNSNTLIVEKNFPGGQVAITETIENYPGFKEIVGADLTEKMYNQAEKYGVQIRSGIATNFDFSSKLKSLELNGKKIQAKSIILATGVKPKHPGLKNEAKFIGRGISFCATCDANFYIDKEVAVIGGGDSALEEALYLTKFVKKVTIIHRRDKLRATKIFQERAFKNPKIDFIWNADIQEVTGHLKVESIIYKDKLTGETKELKIDGIFVFIGLDPATEDFKGLVNMDEAGFVKTSETMETNLKGIFAAGDLRVKPLRQVVTAVSDGAVAAKFADKYIEEEFEGEF